MVVSEGQGGRSSLGNTDDGVNRSGNREFGKDGRDIVGENFESARFRRNR